MWQWHRNDKCKAKRIRENMGMHVVKSSGAYELTSFDEVWRALASRGGLLTRALIFLKDWTTDIGTAQ